MTPKPSDLARRDVSVLDQVRVQHKRELILLDELVEEAHQIATAFVTKGWPPEVAATLTDITLDRWDNQ